MLQQQNQSQNQNQSNNKLLVPQAEHMMELMKQEIAEEFGITLGAETSARDNGKVGGEMTKRLVKMAQEQMMGNNIYH